MDEASSSIQENLLEDMVAVEGWHECKAVF